MRVLVTYADAKRFQAAAVARELASPDLAPAQGAP